MWSQKKVLLVFLFDFFFLALDPAHFHLAGSYNCSFSHFLTDAIQLSCFSFNEIRPPLFIPLSLLLFHDLLSTSVKTKI